MFQSKKGVTLANTWRNATPSYDETRNKHKVGGLDSQDQSRSRSRTSIVSRLTFENCRDYPSFRDQLFFISVEIFQSRFFSRDFDASRFLSRLLRFAKTRRDFRDLSRCSQDLSRRCRDAVETLSRFVKKSRHCRGLLSLKIMKSLDGLRNLDKKIQKSTHFLIEIETNCQETLKFSDLDEILDLDRDFLVWTLMSRRNRDISIVETYFLLLPRFSRLSRLTL